jgi:hypothetical protein
MPYSDLPETLGELRASRFFDEHPPDRTLKDELRSNLICKLERGETLFPGVMGYDDTVVPQIVNPVAKFAIIRCVPSARHAGTKSRLLEKTHPSSGFPPKSATSKSSPLRTSPSPI